MRESRKKTPLWILKLFSISFGLSFSFVFFELLARLAPASDNFSLVLPLKCSNINKPDIDCLYKRQKNKQQRYTKGKFPPFEINALKNTNDIGQFSDINFSNIQENNEDKYKIISIGDSYVEALQLSNKKTFHGKLNQFVDKEKKQVISTAIGTSGNAFPQYLTNLKYAKNNSNLKSSTIIFPIISNDFDESFSEYQTLKIGSYFKKNPNGEITHNLFFDYLPSFKTSLRRLILSKSALSRYLVHNLEISSLFRKYPFCLMTGIPCHNNKVHLANIQDSTISEDSKRYEDGVLATKTFLRILSEIRSTPIERKNTIFVIDADRYNIYDSSSPKSKFFKYQREFFIAKASSMGYTIVDLEKIFRKNYEIYGSKFEFVNDSHWNEYTHHIITEEISRILNLNRKNYDKNVVSSKVIID